MKTNEELAHTLNWLVEEGRIPGLLPEHVTAAAKRLIEQGNRIAELEAILGTNKHTATVEVVEGDAPFSKEIRVRIDLIDPRPYQASHYINSYQLLDMPPDYIDHVARSSLRMASRAFEEALWPQAMEGLHKAVQQMKKMGAK